MNAPEVEEASVRIRLPPDTATLEALAVTLFMRRPFSAVHFVRSRLVPENSSPKASVHEPGTPNGTGAAGDRVSTGGDGVVVVLVVAGSAVVAGLVLVEESAVVSAVLLVAGAVVLVAVPIVVLAASLVVL